MNKSQILVVNAGSSSYKAAIFDLSNIAEPSKPIWKNNVEYVGNSKGSLDKLFSNLPSTVSVCVIGQRFVHGGSEFIDPVLITPQVKKKLESLDYLAPLHNPVEREVMEQLEKLFPEIPQYAVFDTAFHHTIPEARSTYALSEYWRKKGFKRFGFHGISHEYCSKKAAELLGKPFSELKAVTCHLGNGCSLAAIENGKSVDTTMGYTPLEGLIMGTRSGSIDPGILIEMTKELSSKELERCLNEDSGLKGICGDGDMRRIEERSLKDDSQSNLALNMFVHSLKKNLGAMIAGLTSLDTIVFAGGIGEHSATVRKKACENLGFLGVFLDENKNNQVKDDEDVVISRAESRVKVLVIHTKEEFAIAQKVYPLFTKS